MSEEPQEISYEPLAEQEFGFEEMFAQGASALDLAAVLALERKDIESLIKVAREWTRMAKAVSSIETLPEDSKKTILKFGFNKEEDVPSGNADSSDGKDELQNRGLRLRKH